MAFNIVIQNGGVLNGNTATAFKTAGQARSAINELGENGYECGRFKRTANGYQFTIRPEMAQIWKK